jgi:hypothetical protein
MLSCLRGNRSLSSKFHAITRGLARVHTHSYAVSNVLFGQELEMAAAKDAGLAGLRVSPLSCHHPPTAQRGCLYLNVGDGGKHTLVKLPACATPEEENQTDDDDEDGTSCDNENSSRVHALFPTPGIPVVPTERVPEQVYTMCVPKGIKSA